MVETHPFTTLATRPEQQPTTTPTPVVAIPSIKPQSISPVPNEADFVEHPKGANPPVLNASDASDASEAGIEADSDNGITPDLDFDPFEEGPQVPCCNCLRQRGDEHNTMEYQYCCDYCEHEWCHSCVSYQFWDCCNCNHLTENAKTSAKCETCGHKKCSKRCRDWNDFPEPEAGDEYYRTEMLIERVKVANLKIKKFLPNNGFKCPSIEELFGLNKSFPREVSDMIYENTGYAALPKPRTIYVYWNHHKQHWSYNSRQNMIPNAIYQFGGYFRATAEKIMKPAPCFGAGAYRWFNYDTDTLELVYNRCGDSDEDQEEYDRAMLKASKSLVAHQKNKENAKHQLQNLMVEWCQHYAHGEPGGIVSLFLLPGLKQLRLIEHNHYNEILPDNIHKQTDSYAQEEVAKSGDLWDTKCEVVWDCNTTTWTEEDMDVEGEEDYGY